MLQWTSTTTTRGRRKGGAPPPPAGSRSWSDLPVEIAGEILGRVPSFADRARFSSACRQWRLAAAELHGGALPPPLPWLVSCYKGAFDSLPYGDRHYLALDSPACLACDGGWLLFDRRAAAAGGYLLKNPISKAAMELPGSLSGPPAATAEMKICKLVVMSHDLVAAIVSTSGSGGGGGSRAVALCRPGTSPSWSAHHPPGGADHQLGDLRDIAVHGGKLYALHGHGNLCAYDLTSGGAAGDGEPKVSSCVHHIAGDALPPNKLPEEHDAGHHLVPSATGGELLLVRHLYSRFEGRHFTVFVADVGGGRWSEAAASSLRDQLIFVGTGCSRALTASHYGGAMGGGSRVLYTNDVEAYSSTHSYLVYDMIMRSNGPVFPTYYDDYLHEGKRRYRYEDTRYRSWFFPSSV